MNFNKDFRRFIVPIAYVLVGFFFGTCIDSYTGDFIAKWDPTLSLKDLLTPLATLSAAYMISGILQPANDQRKEALSSIRNRFQSIKVDTSDLIKEIEKSDINSRYIKRTFKELSSRLQTIEKIDFVLEVGKVEVALIKQLILNAQHKATGGGPLLPDSFSEKDNHYSYSEDLSDSIIADLKSVITKFEDLEILVLARGVI